MKKKIVYGLLMSALLLLFINAHSQDKMKANPEDVAKKETEWMKTNLKLTDDQTSQAQAINLKYCNKMHDMQGGSLTKQQKMEAIKTDQQAKDAEMKNVLSADQYKSYEAKKTEMKKQMKEKMKEKKTAV